MKQELVESGHATHFPLGLAISTTKHLQALLPKDATERGVISVYYVDIRQR